jgi:tRNA ligase
LPRYVRSFFLCCFYLHYTQLCDDSFEEHVLAYPPEKTGLHLHGLNTCTKDFHTLPHSVVDAFAEEWGFIKTATTTLNTIQEVREFTDAVAKAGEWNGEAVEGFVVRTHVVEPPTGKTRTDKSPYAPGSSFFFKVKFDEPYMMYRDWREVTKSLLSSKGAMKASNLPKSKMKRAETKVYVKWVIEEIRKHPEEFAEYTKGKGIVRTREKFLAWLAEEGKAELKAVEEQTDKEVKEEEGKAKVSGKTVIVPIAIPGCGKTAVSVALAHIFGFGHTQSDDVHVKKAAPIFVKNVMSLLQTHDVVIADKYVRPISLPPNNTDSLTSLSRNNHLRQHRQSIRESTSKLPTPVRLLALNWSLDKPPSTIHRICADRIQSRGANHQTLRADLSASKSHEDVVWMFINTTEELASSEVDECIEMELEDSLEEAVERAVDGVARILGIPHPGEEKVKEGVELVKGYEPSSKKPDDPKKKAAEARYYGLLPEVDLAGLLDAQLAGTEGGKFWDQLKKSGRVTKRPHVTLVHKTELPASKELWDRCAGLHTSNSPPLLRGTLGSVVWDGRVMAVSVDDVGVEEGEGGEGLEGEAFVAGLGGDVRGRMHITVGTRDGNVAPVEAKGLVEGWRRGEAVKSVKLGDVVFRGRVKALMN